MQEKKSLISSRALTEKVLNFDNSNRLKNIKQIIKVKFNLLYKKYKPVERLLKEDYVELNIVDETEVKDVKRVMREGSENAI